MIEEIEQLDEQSRRKVKRKQQSAAPVIGSAEVPVELSDDDSEQFLHLMHAVPISNSGKIGDVIGRKGDEVVKEEDSQAQPLTPRHKGPETDIDVERQQKQEKKKTRREKKERKRKERKREDEDKKKIQHVKKAKRERRREKATLETDAER